MICQLLHTSHIFWGLSNQWRSNDIFKTLEFINQLLFECDRKSFVNLSYAYLNLTNLQDNIFPRISTFIIQICPVYFLLQARQCITQQISIDSYVIFKHTARHNWSLSFFLLEQDTSNNSIKSRNSSEETGELWPHQLWTLLFISSYCMHELFS